MTKGFLLDTNVISETMRPRPDPRVLEWLEQRDDDAYLSVVTIGEIEAGNQQALARARQTTTSRSPSAAGSRTRSSRASAAASSRSTSLSVLDPWTP